MGRCLEIDWLSPKNSICQILTASNPAKTRRWRHHGDPWHYQVSESRDRGRQKGIYKQNKTQWRLAGKLLAGQMAQNRHSDAAHHHVLSRVLGFNSHRHGRHSKETGTLGYGADIWLSNVGRIVYGVHFKSAVHQLPATSTRLHLGSRSLS